VFRIILISILCSFIYCAPYLLYESTLPKIIPNPNKTTIVYLRSFNIPEFHQIPGAGINGMATSTISADFEGAESFIYAEGKYVGGLKNNCMTIFEVDTGIRLITSEADFKSNLKIHAIANRVYYIEEIPVQFGPLGSRPVTQPISKSEASGKMDSTEYKFTKPNPERLKDDMDSSDLDECNKDWDDWAKDNKPQAEKQLQYNGY
jgi:hypothetical protein